MGDLRKSAEATVDNYWASQWGRLLAEPHFRFKGTLMMSFLYLKVYFYVKVVYSINSILVSNHEQATQSYNLLFLLQTPTLLDLNT